MDRISQFGGGDWRAYEFAVNNSFSWNRIAGKSEHERGIAARMADMLAATEPHNEGSIRQASAGLDADARQVNDALYGMLATTTTEQAHDLVRAEERTRCGITAWVRLRGRFKQPEMTAIFDVVNFNWRAGVLEKRWRAFTRLVNHMSERMADNMLEMLVIQGMKTNGATAVHEALRLKYPQQWSSVVETLENYINTTEQQAPVAMDVSAVHKPTTESGARAGQGTVPGAGKGGGPQERGREKGRG